MADDEYSDFSKYPISISEAKGDRSRSSLDWKPRDALIHILRQLDRGEINPDTLIVCHGNSTDPKVYHFNYAVASQGFAHSIALLETVKHKYMEDSS